MINDEVIICNTFAHEVDFLDFKKGSVNRKIPSLKYPTQDFKPDQPAQGTVLESGNAVILDSSGFIIFGKLKKIEYYSEKVCRKRIQIRNSILEEGCIIKAISD